METCKLWLLLDPCKSHEGGTLHSHLKGVPNVLSPPACGQAFPSRTFAGASPCLFWCQEHEGEGLGSSIVWHSTVLPTQDFSS